MALTRFFFITSLLLLSLQIIVSASDYSYSPKPDVDTKAKPEDHSYSPNPNPKLPKDHGHIPKPDLDKQKPKDHGYTPKPDLEKLKPKDHGYTPKPDLDKLKPEGHGYVTKPKLGETEKPLPICIEGLVLCKSGLKYSPIKGAVARITCQAGGDNGYEKAPYSIYSDATDSKGYFSVKLSLFELGNGLKLTECKAYLEDSPMEDCKVPTDVNRGISGALLASYRILNEKKMKLYSVGPFFYTSEPKSSAPNGY